MIRCGGRQQEKRRESHQGELDGLCIRTERFLRVPVTRYRQNDDERIDGVLCNEITGFPLNGRARVEKRIEYEQTPQEAVPRLECCAIRVENFTVKMGGENRQEPPVDFGPKRDGREGTDDCHRQNKRKDQCPLPPDCKEGKERKRKTFQGRGGSESHPRSRGP